LGRDGAGLAGLRHGMRDAWRRCGGAPDPAPLSKGARGWLIRKPGPAGLSRGVRDGYLAPPPVEEFMTSHVGADDMRSSSVTGIALMCAGVACLCVNDAIGKTLTANYSPLQILFLRNAIALPVAALVALRLGGARALRSHRPAAHLLRGA